MKGKHVNSEWGPCGDDRIRLDILRPSLGEGGADRVTLNLLRNLDRDRFQSRLLLMRKTGPFIDDIPSDIPVLDLGADRLWQAIAPLTRVLGRRPPNVLFSTASGTNLIASIARSRLGPSFGLVLSERTMPSRRDPPHLKRKLAVALKRWLYRRADRVTAVSHGVAEDLERTLRIPHDRISVVDNPLLSDANLLLAKRLPPHPWFAEEKPIVLGVGRLVPAKDFPTLIRAFADVRFRLPARLVILGEGPLREDLLTLGRELGITDDLDLPGFDKNPFRYMARCSAFVLSSTNEGLPGALIQAMALGAAVISTDCPSGPAEIIEQGESGILVGVGDVGAMAEQIERLLSSSSARSTLQRNAAAAVTRFSVARAIGSYEAVLSSVAAKTRTRDEKRA